MIQEFKAEALEVKVYNDRQAMGEAAADIAANTIRELLKSRTEINIIFAAAPSQNEFLGALQTEDGIDWSRINAFHMDEYIGLAADAPQGFGNFLRDRIFNKLPFKSVHYLNGNASDPEQECQRYSQLLEKYPTDIVCMGIGENGHLAFNDPPVADFNDVRKVKVVELDHICRQQQVNDGCFAQINAVPTEALTLTIPALFNADAIFCVVPGPTKANAVFDTINKDIKENHPSTILRKHQKAILFIDRQSGGLLKQEN